MLPLKWRIFRVISYLHMVLALVMGVYTLYMVLSNSIRIRSTDDILAVSFLVIFSASLLGNSSINLYLLEKFFPDKVPGKKIRIFSGILYVLSSIAILFVLIGVVSIVYDISSKKYTYSFQYVMMYLVVSAIAILGLTGCYILWVQVSLRKSIRRNYEASLNNFLAGDPS